MATGTSNREKGLIPVLGADQQTMTMKHSSLNYADKHSMQTSIPDRHFQRSAWAQACDSLQTQKGSSSYRNQVSL